MGSTSDSTTEAERISDGFCFNVFVVNKALFPSTTVKRSLESCVHVHVQLLCFRN